MKRFLLLFLTALTVLQCACAAVPVELADEILSSDDVELVNATDSIKTVYTHEYAYVRGGGEWRDKNWHQILAERGRAPMLIMKNGIIGTNVTRLALLKFDLSDFTLDDVGSALLAVKFTEIQSRNIPFDIFVVSSDWKEDVVTFSSAPEKLDKVAADTDVMLMSESGDVTGAVRSAIASGNSEITLMLVQTVDTELETKIEFSKLKEGEMPHLIIDRTGADKLEAPTVWASTEDSNVKNFYTTEYAYVRGGTYSAQNWHAINEQSGNANIIYIKNGLWKNDIARLALFRFDISGLDVRDVGSAELFIKFSEIQKGATVHFDLYLVDNNWNEKTVTWNTQPKKLNATPVIANAVFGTLAKVDATEFIEDMIFDGTTNFTLMLVQIDETDTVTKINLGSTVPSAMPHFRVYTEEEKNGAFVKQIVADKDENQAIWDRAKQMYDEWYARYQIVKAKPLVEAELIESDMSQFDKTVMSPGSNPSGTMQNRATRTVDSLTDISEYVDFEVDTKLDKYGGIMDNALRQEITGFFYTKKIGDRWWVIDPLGYPCVLKSVSGVTVSYQNSPTQKAAYLSKFGTPERWAISTTRRLIDDLGFNCTSTSDNSIYEVVNGLTYFKRFNAMSGYASAQGINAGQGGRAKFSENNTMPVFDPGFEEYVDKQAQKNAVSDDTNVIAYITDNELPMDLTMLIDCLTVDPSRDVNHYTYACAWYWVTQMVGKEDVTDADLTDELMDLFRAFVWDRYYQVVATAIKKYDPNHMYAGTKYLNWAKESEWILRFTAEYVDILTINWYGAWEPQAEFVYAFARYADAPFMVTEFYAKSSETFDNLACKDGAGFFVKTQADRGLFYQNYTLRLLEAKNCVGWQWFQYTDNDPAGNPTDISSRDANKGIVNNKHEEYTELTDDMTLINKNFYKLIEYFDTKYSK